MAAENPPWADALHHIATGDAGLLASSLLHVPEPSPPESHVRDLNVVRCYADHKTLAVKEIVQNWRDQAVEVAASIGCPGGLGVERLDAGAAHNDGHDGRLAARREGGPDGWRLFVLFGYDGRGSRVLLAYLLEERLTAPDGTTNVVLCNCASAMGLDMLRFGKSSRSGKAQYAGSFGEGMKVEVNRLCSVGVDVEYVTGAAVWRFGHGTESSADASPHDPFIVSVMSVADALPDLLECALGDLFDVDDTYVCLSGLPIHGGPSTAEFLFLQDGADGCSDEPWMLPRAPILTVDPTDVPQLQILFGDEHKGKIFAHGIFVCKAPDIPSFGLQYNGAITDGQLGRDRDHIKSLIALEMLPEAILATLLPDVDERARWVARVEKEVHCEIQRPSSVNNDTWTRAWVAAADNIEPRSSSGVSAWSQQETAQSENADALRLVVRITEALISQKDDPALFSRTYELAAVPPPPELFESDGSSDPAYASAVRSRMAGWAVWSLLTYAVFSSEHDRQHVPIVDNASENVVDEKSELRFLGATPVHVGRLLYFIISKAPSCPTLESLWDESRDHLLFETPEYVSADEEVPYALPPDLRLLWDDLGPEAATLAEELRTMIRVFFDDYVASKSQVRFKAMPEETADARSKPIIPVWADRNVRPRKLECLVIDLQQFFPDAIHKHLARLGEACPDKEKRSRGEACSCLQFLLIGLVCDAVAHGREEHRRLEKKTLRICISGYEVSQQAAPVEEDEDIWIDPTPNVPVLPPAAPPEAALTPARPVNSQPVHSGSTPREQTEKMIARLGENHDNVVSSDVDGTILAEPLVATEVSECVSRLPNLRCVDMHDMGAEDSPFQYLFLPIDIDVDMWIQDAPWEYVVAMRQILDALLERLALDGSVDHKFFAFHSEDSELHGFNEGQGQRIFLNMAVPFQMWDSGCDHPAVAAHLFVLLCHEIAHNISPGHNKQHEAAMEALLSTTLPSVAHILSSEA